MARGAVGVGAAGRSAWRRRMGLCGGVGGTRGGRRWGSWPTIAEEAHGVLRRREPRGVEEVATGDGDEGGGGGSGDGRRRRRVRRKKKRSPYIGEGPLVPASVNTWDEKTFSPGWYYEPGTKGVFWRAAKNAAHL